MAIRSIEKCVPFTTQIFDFGGTRVQSWQNDQIDILQKNKKMIAMGFFFFMVNSYEVNKKNSNEAPESHLSRAQKIPKHAKNDIRSIRVGTFFRLK